MKRNMIRLAALPGAFLVSGMVMAHPGHDHLSGVNQYTHHLAGVGNLPAIVLLVLVVGCYWAFARRK